MLFNQRPNRKANVYLIIILFVVGLQRFVHAIEVLGFITMTYSPLKIRMTFAFFIVPIYFLFFNRLIRRNNNLKKELIHFVLPILLVLTDAFLVGYELDYYLYAIFSGYYFILILVMVKELIGIKKLSMFEKGSYKTIRTWALLMAVITFFLLVFSNYLILSEPNPKINLNVFYNYSSLLWLAALIYMFRNPIIIFGEYNLLKNSQLIESPIFLVWSRRPLKPIEEKDKIVHHTIVERIDLIVLDIQKIQNSIPIISSVTLTISTLSKELKIPKRHLEFIFKYYCYYSISDFGNLVKVNFAVKLLNEGFLNNFTVASLGQKCLFKSRNTFHINFKKFIGVSVSDFAKKYVHSS